MIIFKKFAFDSAHFLPNVHESHKCKNVHGHTYSLTVFVEGNLDEDLQWVMDFKALKDVVKPIIDRIDHQMINDLPGLENPTAERIIIWIWDQIKPKLPLLVKLELNETPTSGAIYEGK